MAAHKSRIAAKKTATRRKRVTVKDLPKVKATKVVGGADVVLQPTIVSVQPSIAVLPGSTQALL